MAGRRAGGVGGAHLWGAALTPRPHRLGDLGLEQFSVSELFSSIFIPGFFLLACILQLHYFHQPFMQLTDLERSPHARPPRWAPRCTLCRPPGPSTPQAAGRAEHVSDPLPDPRTAQEPCQGGLRGCGDSDGRTQPQLPPSNAEGPQAVGAVGTECQPGPVLPSSWLQTGFFQPRDWEGRSGGPAGLTQERGREWHCGALS